MANITLEEMLQAGAHFGHQTKYWNPKMEPFIFGIRNKIHIINLEKTVDLLPPAVEYIKSVAARNNKILFVGTKRTASKVIKEEAERCSMPYVSERWLGGMLTNYKTIRSSIKRLQDLLTKKEDGTFSKITKKEGLRLQREIDRLEKSIGGVTEMGGLPDALFIVDVKRENIAVSEASKMGIPIIGVVDTNSNPSGIDYVIPGNDDATRAITTYCDLIAQAVLSGLQKELAASGADVGAEEDTPGEQLPNEGTVEGNGDPALAPKENTPEEQLASDGPMKGKADAVLGPQVGEYVGAVPAPTPQAADSELEETVKDVKEKVIEETQLDNNVDPELNSSSAKSENS